ncbi:MAG: hypothetical protein LQ346_004655 [Caloplaca aetnensis]|nr:MAG: hypothetical protein LQ346_004655 [Caloplaca aetnensis]
MPPNPTSQASTAFSTSAQNDWTTTFFKQEDMPRRYRSAELITGAFARTLVEKAGLAVRTAAAAAAAAAAEEEKKLTILDNGCGIGAVAAALHEMLDEGSKKRMELTCGDSAPGMLDALKERIVEKVWGNTETRVVDAQGGNDTKNTELPDAYFSHVLANFVIMGLQEPDAALNESHRILRPSGLLAFTTWQHVDWVADLRAAFATLSHPPPFPDDLTMYRSWGGNQGDWHSADWVREHLSQQKTSQHQTMWTNISVDSIGKDLTFATPAQFVDTFAVMIPFILKKFWSEEERREMGAMAVPKLSEYMEGKYGKEGPVRMHWVAIVATAKKIG